MTDRRKRTAAALAATGLLLTGTVFTLGPSASTASSHREAPLIASDPAADNTDLYAFVSPDRPGYVTMIANWTPFEEPNGGPNFYPFATDAAYKINVDSDGDAERIFAALADGGRTFMPMQETFFATRFGQLQDRFGINWMIIHARQMPQGN